MGGDRIAEPEILRPTGLHPRGTREPPVVASSVFPFRSEWRPILKPQGQNSQTQGPRPGAPGGSAEQGRRSGWKPICIFH